MPNKKTCVYARVGLRKGGPIEQKLTDSGSVPRLRACSGWQRTPIQDTT